MYNFKNKLKAVNNLNLMMLNKTLSMFKYENLPDSLPQKELEKFLQIHGQAFITKHEGHLYAFSGSAGGELDAYGNPTTFIVSNPYLKLNKEFNVNKDGVLIKNDFFGVGLKEIFNRFNSLIVENDITTLFHLYNARVQQTLSASDNSTKESAEQYFKKLVDGEFSVISEPSMLESLNIHQTAKAGQGSLTQLNEFHQYIKSVMFNEVGLSSNFNMKRERLISGEVEQGEESLFSLVYSMLEMRLEAIEKINEMFDTEISVDFGGEWANKSKPQTGDIENDDSESLGLVESSNQGIGVPEIEEEEIDVERERERGQSPDPVTEQEPEPEPEQEPEQEPEPEPEPEQEPEHEPEQDEEEKEK